MAMRKYAASRQETIYQNAVEAVGDELKFSSARHLVAGLMGLVPDSLYSLRGTLENVADSPIIKEVLREKTGTDSCPAKSVCTLER